MAMKAYKRIYLYFMNQTDRETSAWTGSPISSYYYNIEKQLQDSYNLSWLVINPNFSCGMLSFVVALGFCEGEGEPAFEKVGLVTMILASVLYTVLLA